uniref:Uncharacterized protein n=1 Tax=Myoviridae sp. ctcPl3 TaxID=2826669 RepID=A0A8S5QWM6_9CAUD|nr:MAG TPA: hypothetical protein [Myoviridae sp. ctcPl3]
MRKKIGNNANINNTFFITFILTVHKYAAKINIQR